MTNVQLNKNQKMLIGIIAAMIIGMLIYPPFQDNGPYGISSNLGYSWIFSPPNGAYGLGNINVATLLLQWLGVMIVGVALSCLLKK